MPARFDLTELAYEYPQETVPEGRTPQEYLEELTWEGAAARAILTVCPDKTSRRF